MAQIDLLRTAAKKGYKRLTTAEQDAIADLVGATLAQHYEPVVGDVVDIYHGSDTYSEAEEEEVVFVDEDVVLTKGGGYHCLWDPRDSYTFKLSEGV